MIRSSAWRPVAAPVEVGLPAVEVGLPAVEVGLPAVEVGLPAVGDGDGGNRGQRHRTVVLILLVNKNKTCK